MDPNIIFTFGIPAAVIGSMIWRRLRPAQATLARNDPITQETIAQATPEAPIAMRAWLDYVNRQPDRVPHVAVVGPSGSGKTSLATAVLSDRPGQIVIITAKEGDHWGGLPYVGIDADATYTAANNTFEALAAEVRRRLVAVKQRRMTADWLTVALDDYSTLRKVCPAADEPFLLIARLGRSLRVRLVVLSDSALVKAWGIEGEGETRGNFAFIRLARGHTGTLEVDGSDLPIDTSMVRQIAQRASLADRAWRVPRDPESELADLLADRPSDYGGAFSRQYATDGRTDGRTDGGRAADGLDSERVVLALKAAGVSRDATRAVLSGLDLSISNSRISELRNEQ